MQIILDSVRLYQNNCEKYVLREGESHVSFDFQCVPFGRGQPTVGTGRFLQDKFLVTKREGEKNKIMSSEGWGRWTLAISSWLDEPGGQGGFGGICGFLHGKKSRGC